jgi:protein phosphatase
MTASSGASVLNDLRMTFGARTDVGRRRPVNEDSLLVGFPVFLVADGMGGHEAGDLASASVVEQFRDLVGRDDLTSRDVADTIDRAHVSVKSIAPGTRRGAGSTVSGVAVVDQAGRPHWLIFNLGDSRAYRFAGDVLEQLTTDHSVVQDLVDQGTISRAEMSTYPGHNVITRAVGAPESETDFWLLPIVTGERLLLCTDGLTNEVSDDEILRVLAKDLDPQAAADALVGLALAGGGRDNVTAVVLDVVAGGIRSGSDQETAVGSVAGPVAASVTPAPDPVTLDTAPLAIIDEATLPSARRRVLRG